MRLMSVQVAPPSVETSRNPPAAPTAMRLRPVGLRPRLDGLERKRRVGGRPGEVGTVADPIMVKVKPPLVVFHTRELVKWKNTRPVASRFAGAGMIAVKNPAPAVSANAPRAA